MYSKKAYVLVFVLFVGFCQGYAQQSETTDSAQSAIEGKVKVALEVADSVMKETTGKIGAVTDSLAALPAHVEAQLRAKVDSLQTRLDSLKNKAAGHLAEVKEEAGKLTRKVDSLQSLLGRNLQGFGNLGGLRAGEKLRMQGLKDNLGSFLGDPGTRPGISGIPGTNLVSRIDGQIKNLGGFGRSERYGQYLGAQAGTQILRQYARRQFETLKPACIQDDHPMYYHGNPFIM